MAPLPPDFYLQDTLTVARRLLGQRVLRRLPTGETLSGLIAETEAYAQDDPAMSAFRTPTPRSWTMFGPPGHAYLYLTYRVHLMFNIVCAPLGHAESVLVRALQPDDSLSNVPTNGPGKLTAALQLTTAHNGLDLTDPHSPLQILPADTPPFDIVTTTRIGLKRGADLPRRFYIRGNPFVSRPVSPTRPRGDTEP